MHVKYHKSSPIRTTREGINKDKLLSLMSKCDLAGDTSSDCCDDNAILLEGTCGFEQLKPTDLQVHVYDAIELQAACSCALIEPSLNIMLILQGVVSFEIDQQSFKLDSRESVVGYVWIHRDTVKFKRNLIPGNHVRKINIKVPYHLIQTFFSSTEKSFVCENLEKISSSGVLNLISWTPSRNSIRLAEDTLKLTNQLSDLRDLTLNLNAFSIMRDALLRVNQSQNKQNKHITSNDLNRARRVYEYIVNNAETISSINAIAKDTGMSVSTLQRVFKDIYGRTAIEYLRGYRLEKARQLLLENKLSVTQVAYQVGYSNPSNFSNAFSKEFGYPPSHCLIM